MKKENFGYLDIVKFISSIFIIMLHTCLSSDFGETTDWYISHGVFRLVVPFFFVTAGFFYGKKILDKKNDIKVVTKNYIIKILYAFLFWLAIGFPIEFLNTYDGNFIHTCLLMFQKILFYPWGALWYLSALMVAIFILSKFYKRGKIVEPVIIGFMLYLFALITNSYFFVVSNNNTISKVIEIYNKVFISPRNGIFVGILFVSLGVLLSKLYIEKKMFSKKTNVFMLIMSYIILMGEIIAVRKNLYMEDNSLFLSLPLVAFFLVSILIQLKGNKDYSILRKYSIALYLVHRPVLAVMERYFDLSQGLICFIICFAITFVICFILVHINKPFIKKIIMN